MSSLELAPWLKKDATTTFMVIGPASHLKSWVYNIYLSRKSAEYFIFLDLFSTPVVAFLGLVMLHKVPIWGSELHGGSE